MPALTQDGTVITFNGTSITSSSYVFNEFTTIHVFHKDMTGLIADDLTTIGVSAFNAYTALTTVTAGKLEDIGIRAFAGCTALTTVTAGKLESIGESGFYGCTTLTTVEAENLKNVGGSAFRGCKALTVATAGNLESIGKSAFDGCTTLTTVIAPNLKSIEFLAFNDCTSLTTVTAGKLKSIGVAAFDGCTSLKTVDANNLEIIKDHAFSGCTQLKTIDVSSVTDFAKRSLDLSSIDHIVVGSVSSSIFANDYPLYAPGEGRFSEYRFTGTIEFKTHQNETELSQLRTKFTDVTKWINPPLSVSHSGGDVSGLRAPSIVAYVVGSLLLLFLVGAYIQYRSGRGKGSGL